MLKRIVLTALLLIVALVVWQFNLVAYGIQQGYGQLKVVWGSVDVKEYLQNPNVADSIRSKLQLVEAARQYAFDSIGIDYSDNYTTVYDQEGKAILWVVTASEEFQFVPKTWEFPFLGVVSYKGFFDLDRARILQRELVNDDWDTSLREVGGWSTLGWFTDPILTNMLNRSDGDLAELIIHELTHGTLFVKDSVQFNENLATFIGQQGAARFLTHHFGPDSEELRTYQAGLKDRLKFSAHILGGSDHLDSIYRHFEEFDVDQKRKIKGNAIDDIVQSLDTIHFSDSIRYRNLFENVKPNNAYFMSFQRYRAKQDVFDRALTEEHHGDLASYLAALKKQHPSL